MFRKFRKMICLASFVLVLSLVGNVQADKVTWTADGPDHLWSTPANWDTGTLPTAGDWARIGMDPGAIIVNEGAMADKVEIGYGSSTGELTVDGGTLTANNWLQVPGGEGGKGTLNMISGTITIGNTFFLPKRSSATSHVNLDGGIITCGSIRMGSPEGSVATMDVRAGTLIIEGDAVSLVQGYIDDPNGWITAYDGQGTLQLDYDVTNEGKTTLTAIPLLNPTPADGGLASPGAVELSWTLPDPCVPGQPVPVDVYFTDDLQALEWFTDPAAIQVVSKQDVTSVVVQTQLKTRYYWTVDTYIGDPNDPIYGPIFSFYADNFPPEVDAGADIVTWLEDGVSTGNLDATVIDNEACSVQWMVISEPNDPNSSDAVIADTSAEDTSITLSALGEYVLQLEAFDGEYTSSDTVTINVYNDSCEAAQSLPDYEPFPGDINGDCRVDIDDMLLLLEDWLKDNSLIEE